MKNQIVVVGGANVDIGGQSSGPLIEKDSNPGRVRISIGGVGRNIAHNLRLLGLPVTFLTALGKDAHGDRVAAECAIAVEGKHTVNEALSPETLLARMASSYSHI